MIVCQAVSLMVVGIDMLNSVQPQLWKSHRGFVRAALAGRRPL